MTRIFWAEDDGAGAGGDPGPAPEGEDKDPAYFSQFRKENRERFGALKQYRSLDDLADAALKAGDHTGYLKMPTKDSGKDEIRAFLTQLGVPEGADKYSISAGDDADEFTKGMEATLRDAAYRAGLTDSQAKSMWGVVRAMTDTATQRYETMQKERIDGFDKRFEDLFGKDYPDATRRAAAVKEAQGYFRTFLSDTGLGNVLLETGAIYDERIVKALSEYQKRNRGEYRRGEQKTPGKKDDGIFSYSDEFEKEFGGKR